MNLCYAIFNKPYLNMRFTAINSLFIMIKAKFNLNIKFQVLDIYVG